MRALAAAGLCASIAVSAAARAGESGHLDLPRRVPWPPALEVREADIRPAWLPVLADAGRERLSAQQLAQDAASQAPPAGQQPPPAAQQPAPPSEPPAPASQSGGAATPPSDQDFDLLAPQKPPDEAAKERDRELMQQLGQRRTMLQLHQIGGYATLATVTAAVVLGQVNYLDKYGGGGDTGRWMTPHAIAAFTAAGVFTATGLLALFAPSPLEKPLRFDTATLHKIAMAVATAGMVAQIVLGPITGSKEGQLSQRDFALAHQIVGYTTLVATYTGFLVLTF